MQVVVFVLQLIFTDGTQQVTNAPTTSLKECLEVVEQASSMKRFQDKELRMVVAGCAVQVEPENPA